MLYLIKSYKPLGKSILKIGFTDNLRNRFTQYFYSNPSCEVISIRSGDEILEGLLHFYLKSIGGLQYKKNGCLDEWYINSPEIYQIFHISQEDLERRIWKRRDRIFKGSALTSTKTSDYKLFEYLYLKYNDTYPLEVENFVVRGEKVVKIKTKDVDKSFWKVYKKGIEKKEGGVGNPVVSDFLDNHFYKTNIFQGRMRLYCEFMDAHKDESEIIKIVNSRIPNTRFSQFYNYFGTKGCSSRMYREKYLLEAWGNDSKEEKLVKEVFLNFKIGGRYTVKNIKTILQGIYDSLSIYRTAKATDLGEYFKLTKTKITLPDKTLVNGFRLDAP